MPPTERSIPAVTITNVSPIARRMTSEVSSAMFLKFDAWKKAWFGVASEK